MGFVASGCSSQALVVDGFESSRPSVVCVTRSLSVLYLGEAELANRIRYIPKKVEPKILPRVVTDRHTYTSRSCALSGGLSLHEETWKNFR